jgi:hypothetical protein
MGAERRERDLLWDEGAFRALAQGRPLGLDLFSSYQSTLGQFMTVYRCGRMKV